MELESSKIQIEHDKNKREELVSLFKGNGDLTPD